MMVDFHKELSDRSVIHRYFSPVPLRTRTSHERLISKCSIDYYNEMALVAEHLDCTGKAGIAGVARMIREDTGNRAEVAFLVADRFQRRGLGRFLVDRTIEIAKKAGLASIEGILLFENAEMRKLFQSVGFKFGEPELSVYSAKLMLNRDGPRHVDLGFELVLRDSG